MSGVISRTGAGARIDTPAPAAVSTDLLDVVEPTGPITQLEFELRGLHRALHQLEQTREPIRPHLFAQSLLARPVLNVRDAHRIARFARQEQLTTQTAPFTPRGHHQRAKSIDQTPRLAAGRGDRQRQADHDRGRADCVPHRVVTWLSAEAAHIRRLLAKIRCRASGAGRLPTRNIKGRTKCRGWIAATPSTHDVLRGFAGRARELQHCSPNCGVDFHAVHRPEAEATIESCEKAT